MFSGGVDSFGTLYRLLSDDEFKDYRIHVHHMHLINRENRALAEKNAMEKAVKLFNQPDKFKPFVLTQSVHRYDFMKRSMIWDMDMSAFMAANICAVDMSIKYVAMGRTKTDVDTSGTNFEARMERAQKVFRAVLSLSKSEASYIFPVLEMNKTEVWKMLPEEFRKACWYCRTPVYDKDKQAHPCNRCITCRDMRAVYEAMDEKPPELPPELRPKRSLAVKSKTAKVTARNLRVKKP